jgi:hypothetical protein
MLSNNQLSYDQIEEQLHRSLGHLFVTFAGVELNLSLRVGGAGTFGQKLERFIDVFGAQLSDNDEEFCKISAWYMAADSMRETRNRLAHGRWGVIPNVQLVAHVSGYPPEAQDERRFPLSELEALVKDAELLNEELRKIAW